MTVAAAVAAPSLARACGGFFSRVRATPATAPSLSHEQVLLLYDSASRKEHFIREVTFRNGTEPFGFVVPTPSRPEVAAVKQSPFPALRSIASTDDFPPAPTRRSDNKEGGTGARRAGSGVQVLEVSKVGSFTAFVLAASDARGFAEWLAQNGFQSSPSTDEWLAHYVRQNFFYVAMRYEAPREVTSAARVVAETVRISFATPVPYYPYLEPRPSGGRASPERLLDLWLVSTASWTPISARTAGSKTTWVRPFRPTRGSAARYQLEAALGDELRALLPTGELKLQTFQDQKASREGFGDVLFAPVAPNALAAERLDELKPLLGSIDPALLPAARVEP
jgi:hypothetical protein